MALGIGVPIGFIDWLGLGVGYGDFKGWPGVGVGVCAVLPPTGIDWA